MKEAMVICPQHDNDGHSLQHVRHYAETALCAAFGGCTTANAKGSWVDPRGKLITEPVWCLTVACDPSEANDSKLRAVAHYIGREGKQQSVYLRFPSGNVEILDTAPAAALAA